MGLDGQSMNAIQLLAHSQEEVLRAVTREPFNPSSRTGHSFDDEEAVGMLLAFKSWASS